MAGTAQGWSFLVARGRRKGYRTVLAPAFLTERNLQGVLSDSANGDGIEPEGVRTAELDDPRVGPITLCFRTDPVSAADLNGRSASGQKPPTDEHGRPLELLYGIVARARLSGPADDADLRTARSEALQSYRRFLDHEDHFEVDASRPFALHGVTVLPPRPRPKRHVSPAVPSRPPTHERRRRRAPLSIVAAAVATILLVAWWAWPRSDVDVRVDRVTVTPSSGTVDCNAVGSVILRGIITANGASSVTYHWEHAGDPTSKVVKFDAADAQTVSLDATPAVRRKPRGSFFLVLDSPKPQRHGIRYDFACGDEAVSESSVNGNVGRSSRSSGER